MDTPYIVAVDDGYAQMKLFGDGRAGAEPTRSVFRTSVRAGRDGLADIGGGGSLNGYTTEEGQEFCVSDRIAGENTQFDDFHYSPMNRALVHHALVAGGYEDLKVDLMVGLPVRDFFLDGKLHEKNIERKRANLLRKVERTLGSRIVMPEVTGVQVGCQAVAAYYDYLYDADLNLVREMEAGSAVAIVDVGGRTTDVAVILLDDDGTKVDFSRSGTENVGALDTYKALMASIRTTHQVNDTLPVSVLDKAVRSGKVRIYGEDVDVAALVKQAKTDVQGKIVREIERRIGQAASIEKVIFVGGGAAMFPTIAEAFKRNGVMLDDPEFANARGLWKYLTMARQAQRGQAEAA